MGDVADPDPDTNTETEFEEFPFTGPFFQEVAKRKRQERDAKIIITAEHGQTGVGKTSLAVYLAKVLDTSTDGFTAEKATLNVGEFLTMWDELEPGSAAILDEAEQLDSRRSMTNENVDASHRMQTRRVNEIITIMTLPSPKEIDSRIQRLADYWINCEKRGTARIYKKKIHRIKQKVYYKTMQTVQWPNMDKDQDYRDLAAKKDTFIDAEDSADYIRRSKHEELLEKREKQVRREARDKWIQGASEFGISGADIARFPNVELTPNRIRQIARGE